MIVNASDQVPAPMVGHLSMVRENRNECDRVGHRWVTETVPEAVRPYAFRICRRCGLEPLAGYRDMTAAEIEAEAKGARDAETRPHVHLPDYGHPDFTPHDTQGPAKCGAENVRTMSHHEIKRGRITCPRCLSLHAGEG